jgi:hypothetical protein
MSHRYLKEKEDDMYYINHLKMTLPPGGEIVYNALAVFGTLTKPQLVSLLIGSGDTPTAEDAERSLYIMGKADLLFENEGNYSTIEGFYMPQFKDVSLLVFAYLAFAEQKGIVCPAVKMGAIDTGIVFHNGEKVYETVTLHEDTPQTVTQIKYYLYQREAAPHITPVIILKGFTKSRAEEIRHMRQDSEAIYTSGNTKRAKVL